ncbi:MAG TPA: LptF/LptG family permease [Candidatus Saccharimonadales bacterium]|nr:LptF/LptG family permease [Candidatus Saccharimonadales bacterium]
MRILTRYILKEVLSHGLLGTGVFTFVIFMRELSRILELVVRNSAPVPSVAQIFFLILPQTFTFTIPMGVLVGILIGLSRMSADSEVTAMRAAGVGVGRILKIVAVFGIIAWLLALANNLLVAPRSAAALAEMQKSLAASQASFEVQPRVFYEDFKNSVVYVQDATTASGTAVWKKVFRAETGTPGLVKITLAEQAIVSGGQGGFRLHLVNGGVHEVNVNTPDQYSITTFAETDTVLTPPQIQKPVQDVVPVKQMPTSELLALARAPGKDQSRNYWIEFNTRLAFPSSCLVLVLIGIPLGLSSKKGGKGAGFVLTIILVFIYYFILSTGLSLAKSGKLSPVAGVWLANVVFTLVGFLLLWRVDKMPIELGFNQAFFSGIRGRMFNRFQKKDEWVAPRQRFFRQRFPLILDDYVLRSFLGNLTIILAGLVVLLLIFTFFELLSDFFRNKPGWLTLGSYLLNVSPAMLYQVTPLAVLLAVLVTLGQMQKSNELTAMKATGISIYRAIVPVLITAGVLAVGLFALEQSYLPYANKRQETLRNSIKGRPAQTYLRPDRKWISGQNNNIYYYEFHDPDRDVFGSISVFEFDPQTFQITRRIYAARAHWDEGLQQWVFSQGWQRTFRGAAFEDFHRFPVSTFAELNEPPVYFKKEVHQSSEMSYAELSAYIGELQQSGFDVVRLRVQLYKKLAYPLITIVMAVLAVPFALSAGRRGPLTGVAIALLIAVCYLITSGLFEAMGNINQLPPALAAWSPDAIFALAGAYMVLKTPS